MALAYPTMEQVNHATMEELTRWMRNLPSPTVPQGPVMDRIVDRWRYLKQEFPALAIAASKAVGWDG